MCAFVVVWKPAQVATRMCLSLARRARRRRTLASQTGVIHTLSACTTVCTVVSAAVRLSGMCSAAASLPALGIPGKRDCGRTARRAGSTLPNQHAKHALRPPTFHLEQNLSAHQERINFGPHGWCCLVRLGARLGLAADSGSRHCQRSCERYTTGRRGHRAGGALGHHPGLLELVHHIQHLGGGLQAPVRFLLNAPPARCASAPPQGAAVAASRACARVWLTGPSAPRLSRQRSKAWRVSSPNGTINPL